MSTRKLRTFLPDLVQLESREMPAVAAVQLARGVLTVQTNNTASTVVVAQNGANVLIKEVVTNNTWSYKAGQVSRVDVFGGNGNDTLSARTTSVLVRLNGGNGNDTLNGGENRDILNGGNGNDTLKANGGSDTIVGGTGNDTILGGDGNDNVSGGDGDDYLHGGAGADGLAGDAGKDTIISLDDDTADTIDGGKDVDTFWMDQNGTATDKLVSPSGDVLHAVSGFANTGADRTLDGDRIADPTPLGGDKLEAMIGRPLFSSQGPAITDITQGQIDDSWLLAGLGAIAKADPDVIRQHVVDFGDGTYGVRLGNNFYRVDNDLPVAQYGNTFLQYAATGIENSLWVAIIEKAYAHFRTGADTYASIEGGRSYDVFEPFGLAPSRVWFNPTTSPAQMSAVIRLMIDTGTAPTIGIDVVGAGAPLIEAHQYILMGYALYSLTGLVGTVTLRNPLGVDGPGSAAGPGNDANFNDGILTITLDQLASSEGSFEWGTV